MLISKFNNTNIEKDIVEFEHKYNFRFPEQYRNLLIQYNGGETPKTNFKINKISSDIRAFYGLGNANRNYHYNFYERTNTLNNFLTDNVIPIGSTLLGDDIVIGIGEDNKGIIYYIYHDRPKKYIELAKDFKTFVSKCKSEKLGHIMTIEERIELTTANGYADKIPKLIPAWEAEINRLSKIKQEELVLD